MDLHRESKQSFKESIESIAMPNGAPDRDEVGLNVVETYEIIVMSFALIVIPFVAYGGIWWLARVVVGDWRDDGSERAVPHASNYPSRAIPGSRSDETD